MKVVLVLIVLYVFIIVAYGQWGNEKQKREQVNRLQHEIQGYRGPMAYQDKEQRTRKRRTYVKPGDENWMGVPPGVNEKNERLRQKAVKEEL